MKDVITVDSNSKSEDTPRMIDVHRKQLRAQRWLQDNTHEGITSEPPQDTSLDDIIEELVVDTFEDVVLVQVEDKIKAKRKFLAWHKAEVANLLQVIEDEVMLVRCKDCEGAHFFKAVPLEALKQIKDNVINGGSVYE